MFSPKDDRLDFVFSYGGAFVECSLPHPTEVEIVQLLFRVNEVKRKRIFQLFT